MPGKSKKSSSKSKPSGPVPCAVLWGLGPDSERGAAVRAVLREMGLVCRTAMPERLGDPAGAFARLPAMRPRLVPYAGPMPAGEFVLLCGLTQPQVEEFCARCREEDCVVGAKAALTRENRTWPLVRLIEAVKAEHAAMTGEGSATS